MISFWLENQTSLRKSPAGPRLSIQPVVELNLLREPLLDLKDISVSPGKNVPLDIHESSLDIALEFDLGQSTRIGLAIPAAAGRYVIAYNAAASQLEVDRREAGETLPESFRTLVTTPLPLSANGWLSLRILLDENCIELFAQGGRAILPAALFPDPAGPSLSLYAEGGQFLVRKLTVHRMRSAVE